MYNDQLANRIMELSEELNDTLARIDVLDYQLALAQEDIKEMLQNANDILTCKYCKRRSERTECDNCDDAEWRYKDER